MKQLKIGMRFIPNSDKTVVYLVIRRFMLKPKKKKTYLYIYNSTLTNRSIAHEITQNLITNDCNVWLKCYDIL